MEEKSIQRKRGWRFLSTLLILFGSGGLIWTSARTGIEPVPPAMTPPEKRLAVYFVIQE
jgi:hypothetical protein